MTDAEKREAAHQFINRWMGRGNEDEDGRSYWLEFLSNVMGMENPTERVNFEKKVIVNGNTKRIDVYIPETHVIIEQKSLGKSLDQKIHCSRSKFLTKLLKTFDKTFREIFPVFISTKRREKPSAFFDNNFVNNAYFSEAASSSSSHLASSSSKAPISSRMTCLCLWSS